MAKQDMRKPEEHLMADKEALSNIEQQKVELVRLRIRNKFYNREEILKQVVSVIFKNEIRRDN